MQNRKIIFLFGLYLLISSCGDTLGSVKRGLTGEKELTTDEFLVQKKDPLIMPPDFENLPAPDEDGAKEEKILSFEETINNQSLSKSTENASSNTPEMSILEKIKKNK